MVLVPDEGAVQEFAAASRSAIAFMRGVRMLHSTVRIPASARTASNAAVKFDPRSRIMNLTRSVWSPVHGQVAGLLGGPFPVGCRVTPRMRMRRVARAITART
jgi:hypothetical protein